MSTSETTRLPSLFEFFSQGGMLSRSRLNWEHRPGQLEMAKAVERAFEERQHLVVEAGTGTGKTLAYLLPALRTGKRVILSTGTKALQDQLYFRDIPFLESLLGPLRVTYMKGRNNYLCRQKLVSLTAHPMLTSLDEIDQFHQISTWEKTTETGDRAELTGLPESSQLWHKLDARSEACTGTACPDYQRCFVTAMRQKAQESDLIIVNHHLFFADLAVKQALPGMQDVGVLPEPYAVVFDEAHEIEDIATQYFGLSVSSASFEELARDTESLLKAKDAYTSNLHSLSEQLKDRSRMFFNQLPLDGDGRQPFVEREQYLEASGDLYLSVRATLSRMETELDQMRGVDEAPGLKRRVSQLDDDLKFALESNSNSMVYWLERRIAGGMRGQQRTTYLQVTPIDVSSLLRESLFETVPSVVLTSATLTVNGGFEHIRKRLGVPDGSAGARELIVPSHFDYAKQALLYLPPSLPDPGMPSFVDEAANTIRRVLTISQGRAFCLFTSYAQMREVYERVQPQIPYPILLHGQRSRKALLDEFRSTPNAVLFGTSTFWQGVDVQGEALSCVIIDKLPFSVPNDPVVQARMQAISEEGGEPFMEYQVPSAVIALKQGFGRLIRSLEDRGVLVLLDGRVKRKRYGKVFLSSLPPYRVTETITDVEEFFAVAPTGA